MGYFAGHLPREVSLEWLRPRAILCGGRREANTLLYSPNMLLSGSRDKSLIIWNLTRDEQAYGYPKRSLKGHSHIVSDCVRAKRAPRTPQNSDKNWR